MDVKIIVQLFMTLGILSFPLFKDNPWYRTVESLFVGTALANAFVLAFDSIRKTSWDPLIGGNLLQIIPIILGLLWLTKLTTQLEWLSRWSLAVMTGVGAGITMRGWVQGFILKEFQRQSNFFLGAPNTTQIIYGLIGLVFAVAFIVYNVFTFPQFDKSPLREITSFGRYAQLIVYGIFYASVIMSGWSSFGGRILWLIRTLGLG